MNVDSKAEQPKSFFLVLCFSYMLGPICRVNLRKSFSLEFSTEIYNATGNRYILPRDKSPIISGLRIFHRCESEGSPFGSRAKMSDGV